MMAGSTANAGGEMIRGDAVVLTALDPSNAKQVRGWVNDPEVNRYMLSGHVPVTPAEELEFLRRAETSADRQVLEIHVAKDMRLIGLVGLDGVDLRHRHAELGIMIGDREYQGRGFGRDAIVTALKFAFDTLGLHRVGIKAHTTTNAGCTCTIDRFHGDRGGARSGLRRWALSRRSFFDLLESEYRQRYC
jgi:RimJ/RimL family protein N-acetyltransferase